MAEVSIQKAIEMKAAMEKRVTAMIARDVDLFQQETGLSVQSVDIEMVEVTTYSSRRPEFRIGRFSVEVQL